MVLNQVLTPGSELLPFIKHIARTDATVQLTRVIKGLGFDHQAVIVECNPEYTVVQTTDIRLYASLEGHCHLRSPAFSFPVRAKIIDRNLPRRLVILAGFTKIALNWVERLRDRIQPRTPTRVLVKSGKAVLNASLVDLHPDGIGLSVRKSLVEASGLEEGDRVELAIRLPPHHQWKHLKGWMVHTAPAGNLLAHIGIRLQPTAAQRDALDQYFTLRRDEIMQEVNQVYCRALEPRRVEDLFF